MDLSHQPSKSTDFRSNLESQRGRPRIRIDVAVVDKLRIYQAQATPIS